MVDTVRVINCMREFRLNVCVNLQDVHTLFPHGKFYRGRPKMLVINMSCGRNVQLFPNGCAQILGNVSLSNAKSMSDELIHYLRQLYPHIQMGPLTLKNLVVSARLNAPVPLHRLKRSSSTLSYEPELFPAMLLRRYHPVHIAVFHTGRCIITGLHSVEQGQHIVHKLTKYLRKKIIM